MERARTPTCFGLGTPGRSHRKKNGPLSRPIPTNSRIGGQPLTQLARAGVGALVQPAVRIDCGSLAGKGRDMGWP